MCSYRSVYKPAADVKLRGAHQGGRRRANGERCAATLFPLAALLMAGPRLVGAQAIPGFAPAPGYLAQALNLSGSAIAISPDGKLALSQDSFTGGATISIYDRVGADRTLLRTFTAPAGTTFNFFGGIAWKDANTLAFSENFGAKTVFSASLQTGVVTPLAPFNSLPNSVQLAYKPGDATGALYVGLANGPGANAVYTVANNIAAPFATGLGVGYLGGLAFRPTDGALFVGDTNDPNFLGNAGQVLRLNPNGTVGATVSLAGGGGRDVVSLAFDPEGDLFATTGPTLTVLPNGATVAQTFGQFTGAPPPFGFFPGDLAFVGDSFAPYRGGNGLLLVEGTNTNVGGLFAVQAAPEPSGTAMALVGTGSMLWCVWRKGRRRSASFRTVLPSAQTSLGRPLALLGALVLFSSPAHAQYATVVLDYDSTGANPSFIDPNNALGPPSTVATPAVPDISKIVTVGISGKLVLGFAQPIRPNPNGYDFTVFGAAFYVGGYPHIRYQRPGIVEVGVDVDHTGYNANTPFYRLQGSPDPRYSFSGIDDRVYTTYGYADVTPVDGSGDPQRPTDPFQSGIQPGSAGGDAFKLSWAVDANGNPVTLDHADFIRIRSADTLPAGLQQYTVISAVAIARSGSHHVPIPYPFFRHAARRPTAGIRSGQDFDPILLLCASAKMPERQQSECEGLLFAFGESDGVGAP